MLTWDEVTTLFHEFGHALHGILSNCYYNTLSGTAVPRDFVEMPSQFNESFASIPEIFDHYARHAATGQPMPTELKEKMLNSINFHSAYALGENLAATCLDMAWHMLPLEEVPSAQQAAQFEQDALKKVGLLNSQVPPRYSTSYFNHVWGGGYAAGTELNRPATVQVLDTKDDDWIFLQDDIKGNFPGTEAANWQFIDMLTVDVDPLDENHVFAGGRTGLYEYYGEELKNYWNKDNSILQSATSSNRYVIIAGMTATPERMESIDFTDPYYVGTYGLMVKAGSEYENATSIRTSPAPPCWARRTPCSTPSSTRSRASTT